MKLPKQSEAVTRERQSSRVHENQGIAPQSCFYDRWYAVGETTCVAGSQAKCTDSGWVDLEMGCATQIG